MTTARLEPIWLDARETVESTELARLCGLSETDLLELQDYGALTPLPDTTGQIIYSAQWVMPLRTAGRLRADFELDLLTVSLLLDYLIRIAALEQELAAVRARVPATYQS